MELGTAQRPGSVDRVCPRPWTAGMFQDPWLRGGSLLALMAPVTVPWALLLASAGSLGKTGPAAVTQRLEAAASAAVSGATLPTAGPVAGLAGRTPRAVSPCTRAGAPHWPGARDGDGASPRAGGRPQRSCHRASESDMRHIRVSGCGVDTGVPPLVRGCQSDIVREHAGWGHGCPPPGCVTSAGQGDSVPAVHGCWQPFLLSP